MVKIKMCGLSRREDIDAASSLSPDYIGFVFARGSRRYVDPEKAAELRAGLAPGIGVVGVFVNEKIETVAGLVTEGIIDIIQLHGDEDDEYITGLREYTDAMIIKAFIIDSADDLRRAAGSSADYVLLDSGKGSGKVFDWGLLRGFERPYFLAGGLDRDKAVKALAFLSPYALDVSSGIESDGVKDPVKMAEFAGAVRKV